MRFYRINGLIRSCWSDSR